MNKRIAVIRSGKIVYIDDHASVSKPSETAARERREGMKTKHRKDMLQPNQVEYYKAYKDQAENLNPELRRLLS